jgi:hypothetical protein
MKKKPKTVPINGVNIMKAKMTSMPLDTKAPEPKANHTGPMSPPIKACDEDIGNPNLVQIQIHDAAPVKAHKTT